MGLTDCVQMVWICILASPDKWIDGREKIAQELLLLDLRPTQTAERKLSTNDTTDRF